MKTSLRFASLLLGAALMAAPVRAQTNPPPAAPASPLPTIGQPATATPPTPSSFAGVVANYLSSQDPSLASTFGHSNRVEVISGVDTGSGTTSASLAIDYQIWGPVSVRATGRGAAIGSTIQSATAGVAWHKVLTDIDLSLYVEGGYDWERKQPVATPGVQVLKAMTQYTFAGVGLYLPVEKGGARSPVFVAGVGFVF